VPELCSAYIFNGILHRKQHLCMVIIFVMFHKNMFSDHSVLPVPEIGNCLLNSCTLLLRNQAYDDQLVRQEAV